MVVEVGRVLAEVCVARRLFVLVVAVGIIPIVFAADVVVEVTPPLAAPASRPVVEALLVPVGSLVGGDAGASCDRPPREPVWTGKEAV